MKHFQLVTAMLELGAGLAILCCPSAMTELLVGAPLETPAAWSMARIGGAGILSLGVAYWLARGDTQSRAARGLIAAMLLYNVAAVAVLAFASLGLGLHGLALWPGVIVHAGMAVWSVACLRRDPVLTTEIDS